LERFQGAEFPSFEEGALRPINKMSRYLKQGAAGEVRHLLQEWSDLPGRAESKVALHLFDRRVRPSSKEGNTKNYSTHSSKVSHSFTPSMTEECRHVSF
jgi:hypothetical protein